LAAGRAPAGARSCRQPTLESGPGDRVGWLLLAPIAALLLVAPPTLGSYGVERAAGIDIAAGPRVFERLDDDGGPVAMTLLVFGQRAFERNGASFDGPW
jgi:hypothetical protein